MKQLLSRYRIFLAGFIHWNCIWILHGIRIEVAAHNAHTNRVLTGSEPGSFHWMDKQPSKSVNVYMNSIRYRYLFNIDTKFVK